MEVHRNAWINSHATNTRSLNTLLVNVLCFDFHVKTPSLAHRINFINAIENGSFNTSLHCGIVAEFCPRVPLNDFSQLELA